MSLVDDHLSSIIQGHEGIISFLFLLYWHNRVHLWPHNERHLVKSTGIENARNWDLNSESSSQVDYLTVQTCRVLHFNESAIIVEQHVLCNNWSKLLIQVVPWHSFITFLSRSSARLTFTQRMSILLWPDQRNQTSNVQTTSTKLRVQTSITTSLLTWPLSVGRKSLLKIVTIMEHVL